VHVKKKITTWKSYFALPNSLTNDLNFAAVLQACNYHMPDGDNYTNYFTYSRITFPVVVRLWARAIGPGAKSLITMCHTPRLRAKRLTC